MLAWAIIFMHSIIPHNHVDDSVKGCSTLIHNVSSCGADENQSLKVEKEHSDQRICHLANSIFSSHNSEIFLAYSFRDLKFISDSPCFEINTGLHFSYISKHLRGTEFLRAPPVI
jgi:hypothetical protein